MSPQAAVGGMVEGTLVLGSAGMTGMLAQRLSIHSVRYLTSLSLHLLTLETGLKVLFSQGEGHMECHHSLYSLILFLFEAFHFGHHSSPVSQSRYYRVHFQVG